MIAAITIQAFAFGCLATVAAPQEVALPAHRVVGNVYYGMLKKLADRNRSGKNTFIDPKGYRAYITEREHYYRTTLARQKTESQERGKIDND